MSGDRGGLEHWDAMVRAARAVLGSREDAEDCAATAIAQMYERGWPRGVDNLEAFLVTVTKRRACDLLRSRERDRRREVRMRAWRAPVAPDVEELVVSHAQADWVDRHAAELLRPAAYGVLRGVASGAPIADVAERLGLTQRAAESHLLRARRTMRSAIARALLVVGGVVGVLRRGLPSAAGAAVPAACLAVVAIAFPPIAHEVRPSRSSAWQASVQDATSSVVKAAVQAGRPERTVVPGRIPVLRATSAEAEVLVVEPSRGTRTSVTRGQSRDDERGPVSVLAHCVRDLRLDVQQIGCSGP